MCTGRNCWERLKLSCLYGEKSETKKYKDLFHEFTLLQIADYIRTREPIVTAQGTMFRKHGEVPNPLADTIQSFLDLRNIHKKEMFKYEQLAVKISSVLSERGVKVEV